MNSQLKDLELAAQKREYGTIWKLVNQIAGQNKKPVIVHKLDGSLPKDKAEILDEWSTYFSTLLNNKNIYADPAYRPQPTPDNNSIPTTRITRGEITAAINSLKRSKSPELDYAMTAEVLRDGGKFLQLHKEINFIKFVSLYSTNVMRLNSGPPASSFRCGRKETFNS
jgi:hypothetical protein